MHEAAKAAQIKSVFDDAHRSELSVVILDDLERLLDYASAHGLLYRIDASQVRGHLAKVARAFISTYGADRLGATLSVRALPSVEELYRGLPAAPLAAEAPVAAPSAADVAQQQQALRMRRERGSPSWTRPASQRVPGRRALPTAQASDLAEPMRGNVRLP